MANRTTETTRQQLDALRRRIDALDAEVAELKRRARPNGSQPPRKWWEELAGRFDGDAVFEEIVKEGRKWRRSLRPSKGAGRARS